MLNSADLRAPEKVGVFRGFRPRNRAPRPRKPPGGSGVLLYTPWWEEIAKNVPLSSRGRKRGAQPAALLGWAPDIQGVRAARPVRPAGAMPRPRELQGASVICHRSWSSSHGPGPLADLEEFRLGQSSRPLVALALSDRGSPCPGLGTSARPRWSEPRERMVLTDPLRGGEGPPSPRSALVGWDFEFFSLFGFSTPGGGPRSSYPTCEAPASAGGPPRTPAALAPSAGGPPGTADLQARSALLSTGRLQPTLPAPPGLVLGRGTPADPPDPRRPLLGDPRAHADLQARQRAALSTGRPRPTLPAPPGLVLGLGGSADPPDPRRPLLGDPWELQARGAPSHRNGRPQPTLPASPRPPPGRGVPRGPPPYPAAPPCLGPGRGTPRGPPALPAPAPAGWAAL